MDHGEVPFLSNPANYPYDATYASWPESSPGADPLNWLHQKSFEPNWTEAPASSFITQPPVPLRYREIRPRVSHVSTPATPAMCARESREGELKLERGKHSKQPVQKRVRKPTKNTSQTLSGVTDTSNRPASDIEMSAANTPPTFRRISTVQDPCSLSFQQPPSHQQDIRAPQRHAIATQQIQSLQAPSYLEELPHHSYMRHAYDCTAELSFGALQQELKSQFLRSLKVLREISRELCEFNLKLEIINGWVAEIERVDATLIPVGLSPVLLVLVSFKTLNHILTECVMASGSTRGSIIRSQALELLEFIQTYGERCRLFQDFKVYLEIGKWMERLRRGEHDEHVE